MPVALFAASAAMHGAVVPITSFTLANSTTSDVVFSSIPQVYQDLMVVAYARRTDATTFANFFITPIIVGYATSPQSNTIVEANGTSVTSFRYSSQDGQFTASIPAASTTSGVFGVVTWHCLNYANTSTFKTSIARTASDANGSGNTRLMVGLTRGTNGVTGVSCSTFSGSGFFVEGTTFTVYGVRSVGQ
jgi:hypothetical protein